MTAHAPVYRLRVYAPRSVDPDEETVLTPIGGAAHSNAFQVTTQEGVANWQPYLGEVEGRSGKIDVRTRKRTVGSYTFQLLDKRLGTSHLTRWLTAFTGNDEEQAQLLGCKVYVEESLDGGSTFNPFVVGRCTNHSLESLVLHGLQVRDFAEDFKKFRLFTHRATASYAVEPLVLPVGLSAAYGQAPAAPVLTGTIQAPTPAIPYRILRLSSASINRADNIVTKALLDQVGGYPTGRLAGLLAAVVSGGLGSLRLARGLRLRFSSSSPSITNKELMVRRIYVEPFGSRILGEQVHLRVTHLVVDALRSEDDAETLATSDPYYQAFDTGTVPNGTTITFVLRLLRLDQGREGDTGDLYLGDANPALVWRDALDGDFSRTYQAGDDIPTGRALGDPVWTIPYDATAFTNLLTPTTGRVALPTARFHLTKAWDGFEFIEKAICQPYGLGYRFEPVEVGGVPTCQLVPLDFRIPTVAALGSVPTLDDDDLVRDAPLDWAANATSAITLFTTKYYTDVQFEAADAVAMPDRVPDLPPSLLIEAANVYVDPMFGRYLDLDRQDFTVDALGIRGADDWTDVTEGTQQDAWADAQARAVGQHYLGFFASGTIEVGFTCVRNATTAGLREGDWVICGFSGWPNPSTNVRGGNRLILLTSRQEKGPRLRFTGLDAGVSSGAGAPTIGTPTQTTGNTYHAVSTVVTLNGDGAMVRLRYAVKATSYGATPPADDDTSWVPSVLCTSTGTWTIPALPSGKRIFVQGRSEPMTRNLSGTIRELPSAWTSPSGTKYVDTAAYTAPSACDVTPEPVDSTDTATVTWTVGDASLPVEVRIGLAAAGDPTTLVARLAAGSVGPLTLNAYLDAGVTGYRVGVRHVDTLGGATAYSTDDFNTDAGWTGPGLTAPTVTLSQGTA